MKRIQTHERPGTAKIVKMPVRSIEVQSLAASLRRRNALLQSQGELLASLNMVRQELLNEQGEIDDYSRRIANGARVE